MHTVNTVLKGQGGLEWWTHGLKPRHRCLPGAGEESELYSPTQMLCICQQMRGAHHILPGGLPTGPFRKELEWRRSSALATGALMWPSRAGTHGRFPVRTHRVGRCAGKRAKLSFALGPKSKHLSLPVLRTLADFHRVFPHLMRVEAFRFRRGPCCRPEPQGTAGPCREEPLPSLLL